MTAEIPGLMMCAEHLPTAIGALLTGDDAILHIADLIAFRRAGFANFRAKLV
jgi:hypothetical protein